MSDTGANACFSPGPLKGLTISQYNNYKQAWNKFNDVYNYNSQVSTIIGADPVARVSYYRFATMAEMQQYRQGQSLHSITYPTSNWDSIGTG
jgi:hypothetical protein